jgi:hypothetical protein
MLVHGLRLPQALNLYGKRPWQIQHLDTMEMWRFGDIKTYVSLELLAALFELPSSKSDLDGSQVSRVYHEEHDLERIAVYCMEDVILTAQLYLKMLTLPDLKTENIIRV